MRFSHFFFLLALQMSTPTLTPSLSVQSARLGAGDLRERECRDRLASQHRLVFNSGLGPINGSLVQFQLISHCCYETVNKMVFSKFNKDNFESNSLMLLSLMASTESVQSHQNKLCI